MHGLAQSACPFSVNDADLENATLTTRLEVIRDKVFHVARPESVQIQHPINRHLNGFIHFKEPNEKKEKFQIPTSKRPNANIKEAKMQRKERFEA
jgi:hypothetical protein